MSIALAPAVSGTHLSALAGALLLALSATPAYVRTQENQEAGELGTVTVASRRNSVYLDPHLGRVLQVENALAHPWVRALSNTFYPLHIGAIAGIPTRRERAGNRRTCAAPAAGHGFVIWKTA